MASPSIKVVDSLSLLSLKVAPNVFDLSSGMHHVSIRDQIVRAQLLVRDLLHADPELKELVIIGAGVAGMSAALTACELGIAKVVVLEASGEPFSLFKGLHTRHVGPFMYEWPSPFFNDQSYPAHKRTGWAASARSPLTWKADQPCSADQLATLLSESLQQRLSEVPATLMIGRRVARQWIKDEIEAFVAAETARHGALLGGNRLPPAHRIDLRKVKVWSDSPTRAMTVTPQYILLAAGMGKEDLQLVKTDARGRAYGGANPLCPPFWGADQLLDGASRDASTAVFGGGDGALQDVLRALTGRAHPLELLRELEAKPAVKRALRGKMDELLSLDRQARQLATWTSRSQHDYQQLDRACIRIARKLAKCRQMVRQIWLLIRRGRGCVTLVVMEAHFGKSYLLNRFLMHLFWACVRQKPASWSGRMGLDIRFRHRACNYTATSLGHCVQVLDVEAKTTTWLQADLVAVRYGINPESVPGLQLIQLGQQYSEHRTTLARVELPFVFETRS